jgi:Asp-tRNA(Asn)/Glu-tRNA(Gln) amidotransferase A subunit family amidase
VKESQHPESLSEQLNELISTGLALDHDAYRRSLDEVDRLKKSLWSRYPHIDVILAPAAPGIAPCGQQKTGAPHMSRPWQVMGLPVITLPGLVSEQALPLGVQLIGRAHDDDALLGIANWLEPMLADV